MCSVAVHRVYLSSYDSYFELTVVTTFFMICFSFYVTIKCDKGYFLSIDFSNVLYIHIFNYFTV